MRRNGVRSLNVGNVETFDALRLFGKIQRGLQRFADGARSGFQDAEALLEGMLGVAFDQIEEGALAAALRREDFHFVPGALAEQVLEQLAILKIHGHMNHFRKIFGFQIKLLQQRGHKFVGIEFIEVLPIKFAAIHDAAGAQVEEIGGDERRFGVIGKHIGIVALRGGDALALFDVVERAEKIAIRGGFLEALRFGCGEHALFDAFHQVLAAAFEKHARVAHGFRIALVGGQPGDAGPEAAVNVILQAGARMIFRQIDDSRREPESACG